MKNFLIISFLLICSGSFAQKEANNWYFGANAGITFSSGAPTFLLNSSMNHNNGCATISDSDGSLLFYTNGMTVWNKNHQSMPNGTGLLGSGSGFQNCVIVPFPDSPKKYYIFTVGSCDNMSTNCIGLHYSIVDMEIGNGGDIELFNKNISLLHSSLSIEKVTAIRHSNNKDFWVIVRNLSEPVNEFHAYLVTKNGVNTTPVRSLGVIFTPCFTEANRGAMKVSPDGKHFISLNQYAFAGTSGNEIGYFDALTGSISILFTFSTPLYNFQGRGAEFSQNSRFLYLTNESVDYQNHILQYDLTMIYSKLEFLASMKDIGLGGKSRDLQAGPDGKIYVARYNKEYLGVINNPGLQGIACDYDSMGVYLGGRMSRFCLPQFIQSFFLRFEFAGNCAGHPFQFTPNFHPAPDSIYWDFGDPASGAANSSTETNPLHIYGFGGTYTTTVFVRFPGGRTETATREVVVAPKPSPYPFGDTVICKGKSIDLQAIEGYDSYLWSNGNLTSGITVTDSGSYWIEALNDEGCIGRDTVQVNWFPQPNIDESTLILSPTTCGNTTGAIRGLQLSGGTPPFVIRWLDNDDNILSTALDITNLAVGNYHLWVSDANGCDVKLAQYAINNLDSDLIILDAIATDTRCNQSNGSITITVQPGLSDLLLYSIDNGNTWVDNLGIFTGLLPGQHNIRVKDSEGCEAVFISNPVVIENLPGVEVTNTSVTNESGNDGDGTITITATGDSVYYSLNGNAPVPDGTFPNLSQGTYTIVVADKYGCDTTFQVEIISISGQTLWAVAGDTIVCEGFRVSEPLMVSNFIGIASFELTLGYNSTLLTAESYNNAHPDIQQGLLPTVFPGLGLIKISWTGTTPLSLPDSTILLDLVLKSELSGVSDIQWLTDNDETWFKDVNGNLVDVYPKTGSVRVNPPPTVNAMFQLSVCEGEEILQLAFPSGGTGSSSVSWETPTGSATGNLFPVDSAKAINAGWYKVRVVDELNCMSTDSVKLTVYPKPTANFPTTNDTIFYEKEYQLQATSGYASYQWSTGDTTYYINITEEGEYSVTLQTAEGCTNLEKVMLIDTWFPFNIPNAFTPNGDGLNDSFRPVTDYDRFSRFSMIIYNSWGQRVFETTNPAEGWDGKDAAASVYLWVINYADYLGKGFTLRGSVTLVK